MITDGIEALDVAMSVADVVASNTIVVVKVPLAVFDSMAASVPVISADAEIALSFVVMAALDIRFAVVLSDVVHSMEFVKADAVIVSDSVEWVVAADIVVAFDNLVLLVNTAMSAAMVDLGGTVLSLVLNAPVS